MNLSDLMKKAKDGPVTEDSTLSGFANMLKSEKNDADAANAVDSSTGTATGYDNGGAVSPDKTQAVMSAMGLSGMGAPPMQGDLPTDGSGNYAVTNGDSTLAAPPQGSTAPDASDAPSPDDSDISAAEGPGGAPMSQPTPESAKPDPVQLMQSMVGNDPNQYQQLIQSLQDSDKRDKFADALAIIGDTLGNMGQAKAGQTPAGFTSLNAVQGLQGQNRQRMMDQLQMKVAADPNSQSSKLAQQTLAQAMNIKPDDPRMQAISQMPAAAIMQQMPPMTDAIKLQLARESNQLAQAQLQSSIKDREAQLQIAGAQQQTARQVQQGTNAKDLLTGTSSLNPLNWGMQAQAKQTLAGGQGQQSAPQPHAQDAVAVNWAHMHPNDPRSRKILEANGL